VGVNRALSTYKPMALYSGTAVAHNFINRLELRGNGLEVIAVPHQTFVGNIIGGSREPAEIREHGAEVKLTSCPLFEAGASPEFCVAISHCALEAIVEEINSEYEVVFTHHLTLGDPHCRYVFRRRDDPHKDLKDLGALIKTLPTVDLPDAEKEALTVSFNCSIWQNMVRTLLTVQNPEEMLKSLEGPLTAEGRAFGEAFIGANGPGPGDFKAVQEAMLLLGSALGQEQHKISETADAVMMQADLCALADGPVEACLQFETLANGVCQTIRPDCEFRHESMRTRGDKTCQWTIRKKPQPEVTNEPRAPEEFGGSALELLKKRLVKGEITPDEYRELRDVLLEK
jgi:hypothetical protein